MQKVDLNLSKIIGVDPSAQSTEVVQASIQSSNRQANTSGASRDHIDAINQMFAEFELAYHNQYHKAYAQEGSVGLAKKYWLSCLSQFSPEIILKATRAIVTHQEYLPTIASMVQACEEVLSEFSLPTSHQAYVEACCAPQPKAEYNWSHPAIYFAGKETGWFALANQTEAQIMPLFEYHYSLLVRKVLNGESLSLSLPKALPNSDSVALDAAENQVKLQALKDSLGW